VETSEIIKKVRRIELRTKGLSNQVFSGEYHSAFKGRGMAFSEVREYAAGDEIRTIDWNVTARLGSPYVKVFEEERELTMMLLVDLSASGNFGTNQQLKRELLTEVCAVLAFSAIQNNDKVGVIFFTNEVEKFIPPKKGKSHILRIIRELIDYKPSNSGTSIEAALSYLQRITKKRTISFLISDFMDSGYDKALKIANNRHDLVALQVRDSGEDELPNLGLIPARDAETGSISWIDSSNASVRNAYVKKVRNDQAELGAFFKKSGIDYTTLYTGEPYVQKLMSLFKQREGRR